MPTNPHEDKQKPLASILAGLSVGIIGGLILVAIFLLPDANLFLVGAAAIPLPIVALFFNKHPDLFDKEVFALPFVPTFFSFVGLILGFAEI